MVRLGTFTRTCERPTLAERLAAVAAHSLVNVQLDLADAGLTSLPAVIPADQAAQIRAAADTQGIQIAAVSGTYNMIHPDLAARAAGRERLGVIIAAAPALGSTVVTLCTGTRNRESMWRAHPDNATPAAWADLVAELGQVLPLAAAARVTLGVEPEPGNVMTTAQHARRLLNELGSPWLKVILDPANLLEHGSPAEARRLADEAIDLLGGDIVLAHGKDRASNGQVVPAGTGIVDFGRLIERLHGIGFDGPLILHGLSEAELPAAVAAVRAAGVAR